MLDSSKYVSSTIHCSSNINRFANKLVKRIETSNITAHFCEETNDMYLDVFSCKPFNPIDVEEVVK
jgi:hypothetical protein|uniref:Uncharacterized protein n=1 Tax=viral metagenome TaxID=1070528 RepID=A0A6C0B0Z1_9ZZZZ